MDPGSPLKGMKKVFLFGPLLLCFVSFSPKQICPISNVYAYLQTASPGISPKGPVEEGDNESKAIPSTTKSNYFIYMLSKKKYSFSPTVLWINSQGYEIKMDTITNLPVTIPVIPTADVTKQKTVFVPSTSKRVVMLTPGAVMNFFAPPPPELQKLLDTNELVIEYRWNDETCYFSVPKIKVLERVAAD